MKLIVRENTLNIEHDDGRLELVSCAVGREGIIAEDDKKEGDLKTPAGEYNLLKVYYRADKVGEVETGLPKQVIQKDDGWCDDVELSVYNSYVKLPFEGSHEEMWRDDDAYDIVITISHNTFPPVSGKGSAVFFHVAKYKSDGSIKPTAGCVAIAKDDMLRLLPSFTPQTKLEILAP